eukprot:TRINITY_DN14469_c0_g1_i3.p1 TRINITY_DN14469_c0_g1~~TRINITY_DN14469_c0_g1_i3.p1  ORF type:complete len:505 (+),score=69.23 TRINITY_DN14469_c0_g1_i3:42-1556(+)
MASWSFCTSMLALTLTVCLLLQYMVAGPGTSAQSASALPRLVLAAAPCREGKDVILAVHGMLESPLYAWWAWVHLVAGATSAGIRTAIPLVATTNGLIRVEPAGTAVDVKVTQFVLVPPANASIVKPLDAYFDLRELVRQQYYLVPAAEVSSQPVCLVLKHVAWGNHSAPYRRLPGMRLFDCAADEGLPFGHRHFMCFALEPVDEESSSNNSAGADPFWARWVSVLASERNCTSPATVVLLNYYQWWDTARVVQPLGRMMSLMDVSPQIKRLAQQVAQPPYFAMHLRSKSVLAFAEFADPRWATFSRSAPLTYAFTTHRAVVQNMIHMLKITRLKQPALGIFLASDLHTVELDDAAICSAQRRDYLHWTLDALEEFTVPLRLETDPLVRLLAELFIVSRAKLAITTDQLPQELFMSNLWLEVLRSRTALDPMLIMGWHGRFLSGSPIKHQAQWALRHRSSYWLSRKELMDGLRRDFAIGKPAALHCNATLPVFNSTAAVLADNE